MRTEHELPETYTYPAVLSDCYEGGMWVIHFPDLSGCWYEGATREEVLDAGESLLGEYLAAREQFGLRLPVPSIRDTLVEAGVGAVVMVTVAMDEFRKT